MHVHVHTSTHPPTNRWLSLDHNRVEAAGCVAVLTAATKLGGLQLLALDKTPAELDFAAHLGFRGHLPEWIKRKGWGACVTFLRYFDHVWGRYPGLLSDYLCMSLRKIMYKDRHKENAITQ